MGNCCIKDDDRNIIKHDNDKIIIYKKRLSLIYHVRNCDSSYPEDVCNKYGKNCAIIKELMKHIPYCQDDNCNIKFCNKYKKVIKHYSNCQNINCEICCDVLQKINYANTNTEVYKEDTKYLRSINYNKLRPSNDNYLLLSQSLK